MAEMEGEIVNLRSALKDKSDAIGVLEKRGTDNETQASVTKMEEEVASLKAQLQVKSDAVDGLEKQRADDALRLANIDKEKQKLEVRGFAVFVLRKLLFIFFTSVIGYEAEGGDRVVASRVQGQV